MPSFRPARISPTYRDTAAPRIPRREANKLRHYNILVAEDDPMIGLLLVDLLTAMGHKVCALQTTEEGAVAAAAGCNPDLLLMDVHLSHGSGLQAVATIQRSKRIPYMYMTGALAQAGQPGDIVLYKPFVEADLIDAIDRVSASDLAN